MPNSLAWIAPDTPWATHPEHLCRFWVRLREIHPRRLFTESRVRLNAPKEGAIPAFLWFSPLRYSPELYS